MHLFELGLNVANTPHFVEGEHSKYSLESGKLARFSGRHEIRFLLLGPLWSIDLQKGGSIRNRTIPTKGGHSNTFRRQLETLGTMVPDREAYRAARRKWRLP